MILVGLKSLVHDQSSIFDVAHITTNDGDNVKL